MKIVKMDKGPPTIEEGRRRLDTLFEDFISRGADAEFGLEKEIVFTPEFLTEEKDPE